MRTITPVGACKANNHPPGVLPWDAAANASTEVTVEVTVLVELEKVDTFTEMTAIAFRTGSTYEMSGCTNGADTTPSMYTAN
jgi:hypothetical protein